MGKILVGGAQNPRVSVNWEGGGPKIGAPRAILIGPMGLELGSV